MNYVILKIISKAQSQILCRNVAYYFIIIDNANNDGEKKYKDLNPKPENLCILKDIIYILREQRQKRNWIKKKIAFFSHIKKNEKNDLSVVFFFLIFTVQKICF